MTNPRHQADAEHLAPLCKRLVKELDESVQRNLAEGVLLSGGLDSSILAYLASKHAKLKAFTVAFREGPAPDIDYATFIADHLKIEHHVYIFDRGELIEAIRSVVRSVDSFDPMEIRNSTAIYIGLKKAKENGTSTLMTGDMCDELFAGYNFLHELEGKRLYSELQKLWNVMSSPSERLARDLGMNVKLPYSDPKFKRFAMGLQPELKVHWEKGRRWGKWILRKAFENLLPKEVVWRTKVPIELGSGTSVLPHIFDSTISDAEFKVKRNKYFSEDGVTIRDKEHLFYYEIYRSEMGVPHPTNPKDKLCPGCNSNIPPQSTYCRRCGTQL